MRYVLLLFLSFCLHQLYAGTYYLSSSAGNDERTTIEAQNPATPWKTLAKLKSIISLLNPGDSVLLKRGDIFAGSIIVTKSGINNKPIVFGAYGNGNKPIISGFTVLSKWVNIGNKTYECNSPFFATSLNMLLINGAPVAIGRYPNVNTANKGYLTFESAKGNVQITDNQLPSSPDWTGGEVIIRKNRWVVDRNLIKLHSGNTIDYISGSKYSSDKNFGYFIQNHPKALDLYGEWYFNSNQKKAGIFFGKVKPRSVVIKASTSDTLVSLKNQSNIVFSNLRFEGANGNAFEINNCSQILITGCDIFFSGINAVNALKCVGVLVENSQIYYSNNIALNLNNCSNTIIRNNVIRCTGIVAGMGKGDSGSYEGVMIDGNNNLIEQNVIDSTGYIPLTFSGNTIVIQNNFIDHFAFIKDDAGGIYTYNGFATPKINFGRIIKGNIILNGIGAGAGTSDTSSLPVSGIYMDDKVNNVSILNNTVANCSKYGIFVHNANSINIKENTLFNNGAQLGLVHDKVAPNDPVKSIGLINNILFSKNAFSFAAEYKTFLDDLKSFGSFDSNYYCRPLDDNLVFNISYVSNGTYYNRQTDLNGWIAMYGKDNASKKAPFKIASYKINSISSINKFANGKFNYNIAGLYAWSAAGNCVVGWNKAALDSGALQVSFSKLTGTTNRASVVIGVGAVTANKTYLFRFSLKGTDEHKSLTIYLRKSVSDYADLSVRRMVMIGGGRSECEILFSATSSQANASVVFDVEEQKNPLYLDNLQLSEAAVTTLDPNTSILFEYNPSATNKTIPINGTYFDVKNITYKNKLELKPFTSAILLRQPDSAQVQNALPPYSLIDVHKNEMEHIYSKKMPYKPSKQKTGTEQPR